MKKLSFLLAAFCICLPAILHAQDDISKYLVGAVPEVDGKVVFQKEFSIPAASQDQIFDAMMTWMENRLKENKNTSRIVYSEKEKGMIAGIGEEYLVFSSSALSLDRTIINYQITVTCQPGKCLMEVEKIRYTYQEKEKYTAEEWIADKYALNKAQTKLVRGISKFRIKTVDFVNDLFNSAQAALGISVSTAGQVAPTTQVTTNVTSSAVITPATPVVTQPQVAVTSGGDLSVINSAPLAGFKQISPDRIPGNIIKMLNNDWMLITAGNNEKFNMMTASWGGLGVLYNKPIAICFINPTRYTYQLMEKNDTYTLTFYTETYRDALQYCGSNSGRNTDKVKGSGLTPITTPAGSKAFSEAWLIIECRKLVSQSLSHEALSDEKLKEEWLGKQLHKMFIGEIINVWVK